MDMEFSRAGPSDLATIAAFDEQAGDPGRRTWLEDSLRRREVHLLSVDGAACAYGVLEDFFGHAFVSLLYVAPARRRQGLGAGLLAHLCGVAATPKVFSSTNLSNAPMHALFARQGWTVSGLLTHLDDGDPEVVYVRVPR
ncbi:GNAT family N-acetyltransferase [Deinococcus koreensis]|uniref:GNAT family N-acetyltransferase n=1 Tax=Deinococcus koreensis TaxID=2054903 RepID=A0A2K3UW76_9DEIO|nr:GNAT family N-acetyltransferase [Deinococcus koreensis]PNY80794.1 GNAT family N-acetyltransferase [Deinococcus koreensis]